MKRKSVNLTTKLAAALLRIKNADGSFLIPEPYRSSGTAEGICGTVQWDHGVLHALDGSDSPQNLYPMLTADHREKSRSDTGKVAKVKRLSADQEAFRARMLARLRGEVEEAVERTRKKATIRSAGFDTSRKRPLQSRNTLRKERAT